ncbi:MAG: class I SAM-dependent methyltransferase [Gemmatimonadetes bacterium]|nr:class I SAM-dependent methyltransferase [Gemmatimonadota bacterium]
MRLLPLLDIVVLPFLVVSAMLLKAVRRAGVRRMPLCRAALLNIGVFPIRDHYYEPQFDHRNHGQSFSQSRPLPGIKWNVEGQLAFMEPFPYAAELAEPGNEDSAGPAFDFDNASFASGDAEYWYQLIRTIKPARIFEIGSGNSTLMAIRAIERNRREDAAYDCRHVCIEPYEMPWLEETSVTVVREKVEDLPVSFFAELESNDILFIDSSHVIRPRGDVLYEYLELLPALDRGVIVHVHDIFSPRNYPGEWLREDVRFWNEQYLLEAFLSHNESWEILGALNLLAHDHFDRLQSVAPFLTREREPGSFYMRKVR